MELGARFRLGLLTAIVACAARAQTAEVTIYSHGSRASDLKPISHNALFTGGIWDGDDPVAMFADFRPYKPNNLYLCSGTPGGSACV